MKSLTKNNSIFSRIKEDITSLLSFSDGSKYTTSEEEITLPNDLRSSLENLKLVADNYSNNGKIIVKKNNRPNSKETTVLNNIKPPIKKQKLEIADEKNNSKEDKNVKELEL